MRLFLIHWFLFRWQCEKDDQREVLENRCKKRTTAKKCLKYYRARLEEGKDVVKLLEFHKLEKERKNKKEHQLTIVGRARLEEGKDVEETFKFQKLKKDENKQNGELSKRLDLLEEKAESELRQICQ